MVKPKAEHSTVRVSEVLPAEYNPRRITEKDMADLVRSITEFGFVEPVVVNRRNMRVVGGHQRVEAAMRIGMEEVPAMFVDLDDTAEKALNLALNKIGGYFDDHLLLSLLHELGPQELEVSGFDVEELERLERKMGPPMDGVEHVEFDALGKGMSECPRCKFRFEA